MRRLSCIIFIDLKCGPQSREDSPVNYAGGVDFQQRIHRPDGRRFNSVKELKQCVSQSVNGINCGNVSTSGVIHRHACVIVTISCRKRRTCYIFS